MGQYCKIWSWNAIKLDFTPARGSHLCSLSLMFVCFQASCCCCGWAGKHKVISRRWVQAICPTVHTQSRSHCCHMLHWLCRCVSICISACTAIGNIRTAIPNTYILLDSISTNTDTSPGLSLQLSRLRASSPDQHITIYKRYAIKTFYTHRWILAIRPHRPSPPLLDWFTCHIREFLSKYYLWVLFEGQEFWEVAEISFYIDILLVLKLKNTVTW